MRTNLNGKIGNGKVHRESNKMNGVQCRLIDDFKGMREIFGQLRSYLILIKTTFTFWNVLHCSFLLNKFSLWYNKKRMA